MIEYNIYSKKDSKTTMVYAVIGDARVAIEKNQWMQNSAF